MKKDKEVFINPVLNNPYEEPERHYATDPDGSLNYSDVRAGRRIFVPDIQGLPVGQCPQQSLFEVNDFREQFGSHLINLLRQETGRWRDESWPHTTRVTRELLDFWFNNPDRRNEKRLFFAQREAIETAVWLNEVAAKSNAGQYILNQLGESQESGGNDSFSLPRIAFKMATGTGKTVVMAALILYHYFNRREYRNDTRFADYFLVVAPGITIKDRLGVLYSDAVNRQDYYHLRHLVPGKLEMALDGLNARIKITNYHGFEPRTLQGNKRSPFDGKLDSLGNKTEAKEDYNQVIKRVLGKFKTDSRLLVLNDEGHHCYYPKAKGKATDDENSKEENARAAVWHTGLAEIAKKFKVSSVYDLSATPYYLSGSGHQAYSLFPWVVSDFGLIEAIESGLVKIPFLPESDDSQELTMPVLRNLYDHVRQELPKKGQERQKKDARDSGKKMGEQPPKLPPLVKSALDQFYEHYEKESKRIWSLFDNPPVFIVVCNNTSVSKEIYKFIAGYELTDGDIKADFTSVADFEFDGSRFPTKTILASPFSPEEKELTVESVKEKRDQEIIYIITKELVGRYYADEDGNPQFQKFNKIKKIVEFWYFNKVKLLAITDPEYRKLLYFEDSGRICEHIASCIRAESAKTDRVFPIFNHYNRFGSTKYVGGNTSRPAEKLYATRKSHVNYVVGDTDKWEQIAAKALEELPQVESYVKNSFLGFAIPYVADGKDRPYFPDFVARCRSGKGKTLNLIIEITGMNKDKAMKKDYVRNLWLPAVNGVREKHGYDEWYFIEIAGDIRDIKNELVSKIEGI